MSVELFVERLYRFWLKEYFGAHMNQMDIFAEIIHSETGAFFYHNSVQLMNEQVIPKLNEAMGCAVRM